MTDNEIVRVLECCTTKGKSCKECPAFVKVDRSKCRQYFIAALDLIRRQQAEIDQLKEISTKRFNDFATEYDNAIKAEAIKEFADRLKEKFKPTDDDIRKYGGATVWAELKWQRLVDNLVKEMGCGE